MGRLTTTVDEFDLPLVAVVVHRVQPSRPQKEGLCPIEEAKGSALKR